MQSSEKHNERRKRIPLFPVEHAHSIYKEMSLFWWPGAEARSIYDYFVVNQEYAELDGDLQHTQIPK